MVRWLAVVVFGLGACGFQSGDAPVAVEDETPDAAVDIPDAAPGAPTGAGDDIINVRAVDEVTGDVDWVLDRAIAIDTGAMTISDGIPTGVTFAPAPQDGGDAELAILRVGHFESGFDITVHGPRALVILARDVVFSGTLQARAAAALAGAPCAVGELGRDDSVEIYARSMIIVSGEIRVGRGAAACARPGSGGTIVLQAPIVTNSGRLLVDGDGGSAGGGNRGEIVLLYRTSVARGTTDPTATTTIY